MMEVNLPAPEGVPKSGVVVASVSVKLQATHRAKQPEQVARVSTVKCPCHMTEASPEFDSTTCCAAEFVDGSMELCSAKVVDPVGYRPCHSASFFIQLCPRCTTDAKAHHFCALCGFRCLLSSYQECKDGHRVHVDCVQLQSDLACPHCDKPLVQRSPEAKPKARVRWRPPPNGGTEFKFTNDEMEKIVTIAKKIRPTSSETKFNVEFVKKGHHYHYQAIDVENTDQIAAILSCDSLSKQVQKMSLFHYAIKKNKIYLAELFLRSGLSPMTTGEHNLSPLADAVKMNSERLVRYCLRSGTDLMTKDLNGLTAGHFAAKSATYTIVSLLINPSNIGDQDYTGFTAIHWAMENPDLDVFRHLVSVARLRDLNKVDNVGKNALHWAAHYGKAEHCKILVEKDRKLLMTGDSNGTTALHYAAMSGAKESTETIRQLAAFHRPAKPDKSGRRPRDFAKGRSRVLLEQIELNLIVRRRRYKSVNDRIVLWDLSNGLEPFPVQVVNGQDDYPLIPFKYLLKSRPRQESLRLISEINDSTSCTCGGECIGMSCSCLLNSEIGLFEASGVLSLSIYNQLDRPVVFDCNELCSCDFRRCRNLRFEKCVPKRVEVFRTTKTGWGLRLSSALAAGEFVISMTGQLVAVRADNPVVPDYLLKLSSVEGTSYCLDQSSHANASRFINHSCDANLVPLRIMKTHNDFRLPEVALFAARAINQNEELTLDYGDIFWSVRGALTHCHCESPKCRFDSHERCRQVAERLQHLNGDTKSTA